jgi:hypothetical protein
MDEGVLKQRETRVLDGIIEKRRWKTEENYRKEEK